MAKQKVIVSVDWLRDHLDDDNLVILDASWHLPPENRDPKQEYEKAHIPGAVFFDLDKHSAQDTALPHMMPDAEQFGRDMGALGIADTDLIVVYDSVGLFSCARVWWMCRQFGAANCYVLDGGLPAWKRAGLPIQAGQRDRAARQFHASVTTDRVVTLQEMQDVIESGESLILDARGPGRFYAREPEPRPGMRGGHMPGAANLHYRTLLDDEMKLRSDADLQAALDDAGFDPARQTITSCGSGVTAAIILLALTRLGHNAAKLYDGSWSEWGSLPDTPINTD